MVSWKGRSVLFRGFPKWRFCTSLCFFVCVTARRLLAIIGAGDSTAAVIHFSELRPSRYVPAGLFRRRGAFHALSMRFPCYFPALSMRFPCAFPFPALSLRLPCAFPALSMRVSCACLFYPCACPALFLRYPAPPCSFPALPMRFPCASPGFPCAIAAFGAGFRSVLVLRSAFLTSLSELCPFVSTFRFRAGGYRRIFLGRFSVCGCEGNSCVEFAPFRIF